MRELINIFKVDPNLANSVAAAASSFTALLALIVSVVALWLQRRHNKLSVRPIPEVTVADYENSLRVKLRNNGVGPLIIQSVRVSDGVEVKSSVIKWMPPALPGGRPWTHFSLALENRTLQQNGSIPLLELTEGEAEEGFAECRNLVRQALSKLEVEVIYTDVYKSKLPSYKKSLTWFGRHTGAADIDLKKETSMNQKPDPNNSLVISYFWLRTTIGIIGIALPFALALGKILFDGGGLQASMSAYYYTNTRNVLVGGLCAIGVFLASDRGFERKDNIAGKLACLFAIGVAFFPTTPPINVTPQDKLIGVFHLIWAALLLLTLAYFSLCLFRKTDPTKQPTPQKLRRNRVYTVCGYTILASILLILVFKVALENTVLQNLRPVFWLEALAVVSFGVSWLTKGETILADEN